MSLKQPERGAEHETSILSALKRALPYLSTMKGHTTQIFVSYSRIDRLAVDQLVRDLRDRNYLVWIDVDETGIEPGEDWQKELVEQLSRSQSIIACVSPDFLKSDYCNAEIRQARLENKPIYPVIVRRLPSDRSMAEMDLDQLQYVNLTENYQDGLRRLTLVLPRPVFSWKRISKASSLALALIGLLLAVFVIVVLGAGPGASIFFPTTTLPPPSPTPSLAMYDVGVAVAQFSIPNDSVIDREDADFLIDRFSNLLEPELRESLAQLRLTVGYLSPREVGRVEGITYSEREENARDIARKYGADIVVYGVINRNEVTNQIEVQPEYYVDPDSFVDALEMTGSFRFGHEIGVDDPISGALDSEVALSSRTTALAHVMAGLSEFAAEDYQEALKSFQIAASTPNWKETEGREVLHILIGNTQLKLAQQAAYQCDRDKVLGQLDYAFQEYEAARQLAPNYSRSYAGLASTSYLAALWTPQENDHCAEQSLNLDQLDQSIGYIEQAMNADDQPREAAVQTKVLSTKAQILFFQWNTDGAFTEAEYDPLFNDFWSTTDRIIRNYENGDYPSVTPLVIEAYGLRGSAQRVLGNYRSALQEYDAALKINSIPPDRHMFFVGWKGDCYYQLGQLTLAADAYAQALQIALEIRDERMIGFYEGLQTRVDREVILGTFTPTAP